MLNLSDHPISDRHVRGLRRDFEHRIRDRRNHYRLECRPRKFGPSVRVVLEFLFETLGNGRVMMIEGTRKFAMWGYCELNASGVYQLRSQKPPKRRSKWTRQCSNSARCKLRSKDIVASPSAARSTLEVQPVPIDTLMRSTGIEPSFRSRPNLFQLKQLSAELAYADGILSAEKITMRVDDSRVSGHVRLEDPVQLAVDVDQIDLERYVAAVEGGGGYDPDAPLVFLGKWLQGLPLDGHIRFGKISARGANLVGVSLRLESTPADAPAPR